MILTTKQQKISKTMKKERKESETASLNPTTSADASKSKEQTTHSEKEKM